MPRGNLERLRDSYAAWNRGDLEAWLADLSPDFEYRTAELFPGLEAVYRGKEGMTRFWTALREPWESLVVELEEVIDLGDRVVTLTRFHGTGKGSGVAVTLKYANVVRFRDGQIAEMVGYGEDWAGACSAAGVSSD